jgi:hypothetical protein
LGTVEYDKPLKSVPGLGVILVALLLPPLKIIVESGKRARISASAFDNLAARSVIVRTSAIIAGATLVAMSIPIMTIPIIGTAAAAGPNISGLNMFLVK